MHVGIYRPQPLSCVSKHIRHTYTMYCTHRCPVCIDSIPSLDSLLPTYLHLFLCVPEKHILPQTDSRLWLVRRIHWLAKVVAPCKHYYQGIRLSASQTRQWHTDRLWNVTIRVRINMMDPADALCKCRLRYHWLSHYYVARNPSEPKHGRWSFDCSCTRRELIGGTLSPITSKTGNRICNLVAT
jgi:hypothetical protein